MTDRDAPPDRPTRIARSAFVDDAEQAGRVDFDLRRRLAAEEAGVGPDQDLAIFQGRDGTIATRIDLPGDHTFTVDAAHLDVVAGDAGPGEERPVGEIRMQASYSTFADARTELDRALVVLGTDGGDEAPAGTGPTFDDATVGDWAARRSSEPEAGASDGSFGADVFRGRSFGAVTTEVTVRRSAGAVTVLYSFRLA